MTVADRKRSVRRMAFSLRGEAHALHRAAASEALRKHLSEPVGKIVAGYLPIRTEADPLPAMKELARRNRVCVPAVTGSGLPLEFREWQAGLPLEEGPFGVMVPVKGAVLVPEVLIVPLVAYDHYGARLGYGGGFYDRTLEMLRTGGAVRAIGFGYSAQQVEDLPLEPTDQKLDEIVTEKGVLLAAA